MDKIDKFVLMQNVNFLCFLARQKDFNDYDKIEEIRNQIEDIVYK